MTRFLGGSRSLEVAVPKVFEASNLHNMGNCSFMIVAPMLWNRQPLNIRQAATIDLFLYEDV